eukprot:s194_g42.t1
MKKPAGKEAEMLALPPPDHGSVANAEEENVAATPSAGEEAPGADAANVPTPRAKGQAKKKAKAKAKKAASPKKAPRVTTSPKKAAKAKAKSALRKVLKKQAAAPPVTPKDGCSLAKEEAYSRR